MLFLDFILNVLLLLFSFEENWELILFKFSSILLFIFLESYTNELFLYLFILLLGNGGYFLLNSEVKFL